MKSRILGAVFVLVVLAVLFVLTDETGNQPPVYQSNTNDPIFQPLKIN